MTDDSDVGDVEIKFWRGTRAYTPPGGVGLAEPHFTHYYQTAASLNTPEPYTHFTHYYETAATLEFYLLDLSWKPKDLMFTRYYIPSQMWGAFPNTTPVHKTLRSYNSFAQFCPNFLLDGAAVLIWAGSRLIFSRILITSSSFDIIEAAVKIRSCRRPSLLSTILLHRIICHQESYQIILNFIFCI